tara:strand:- start:3231 stop:5090 length:1860 start_codon:yes stop_codon:yes gene_type:complete
MADPLEAYNQEIQRRSGPFGLDPAQTKGGVALQFPLKVLEGLGGAADYLLSTPQRMGEATLDYLTSPSQYVEDLQSGKISESEIPLGTDLVDIFGDTDPTLGAPDFVTDDYKVGEIFKFDPTGEGKTKGMPETKAEREGREAKEQLDAEIQAALDNQFDQVAAQKEKDAQRAEDFRKKEAQIADMAGQGSYNQSIDTIADSEQMFASAMQDFIEGARGAGPDTKEMSIEDYKKEFAEATGIDISGKPDKSQALMAFGLALMQNKAGGKGITGMLGAIGEAGQAAMPALEKAKSEARTAALAGGKYALQTRSTDRATDAANREKSLNRPGYYIFERGKNVEDGNKKFNEGKIVYLNAEEINKLITNEDFDKNFSFIKKSEYLDIKKELTKPVELGDMWVKGDPKHFSLIGGDPKDVSPALQVLSHNKNPNYGGETPSKKLLAEDEQDVKNRFVRYKQEIDKNQKTMTELVRNLQEGVSFPKQIAGNVQQLAKSLGLNVDTSTTARAKQALANIAIDNVLEILKESGRTISEGERKRVEKRVAKLDLSLEGSDIDLILNQVEYVYDMVVTNAQKNLDTALDSFENNFGYSIIPKISQEELKAINEKRKEQGLKPRTMDDFK